MGGKKRTKWRKLPLEEFTKEIPPKTDKVPPRDTCQTDLTKEENNYLPSDNEPSEPAQNYTESYEYIDGLWYPTSCVVYNPAEVGLYSNYMMPMDNCYYYYPVPEVPQMQEYVPMPYQEYPPALPKDTVYLLLPTQSLRPTQPVQNIVPEWQGRRRRRRYEGYADYAIIPDKPNATKVDDKYSCKTTGPRLNSRRNSYQSNNCRKMSSFTEPATLDSFNNFSEQKPSCSKSNDMSMTDMNNLKGPTKEMDFPSNKENVGINLKYKNNLERCGTLSGNPEKNEQTATEKIKSNFISSKKEVNPVADLHAIDKADKEKSSSITGDIPISSVNNKQVRNSLNLPAVISNNLTPQNSTKEQSDKMHSATVPKNEKSEPISSLNYTEKEINSKTKITAQKQIVDSAINKVERNLMSEDNTKSNSQSSQPDILSAFNKSLSNEEIKKLDTS